MLAGGVVYVLGTFVVTMVRTIASMAASAAFIAAL
jgi:hypothetical protein